MLPWRSPRLDSCCRSSWSILPALWVCQLWFSINQLGVRPVYHMILTANMICDCRFVADTGCPGLFWTETWGATSWATYGTSFYILTTGTGSQSWWRLPTWSRNVDKQFVVFGCIRVINIVFVSTWWNFSQNLCYPTTTVTTAAVTSPAQSISVYCCSHVAEQHSNDFNWQLVCYLFIYLFPKNTYSNHNWDKDTIW